MNYLSQPINDYNYIQHGNKRAIAPRLLTWYIEELFWVAFVMFSKPSQQKTHAHEQHLLHCWCHKNPNSISHLFNTLQSIICLLDMFVHISHGCSIVMWTDTAWLPPASTSHWNMRTADIWNIYITHEQIRPLISETHLA